MTAYLTIECDDCGIRSTRTMIPSNAKALQWEGWTVKRGKNRNDLCPRCTYKKERLKQAFLHGLT